MNCRNIVLNYIQNCEKNEPIFIEDIKEYIMQFYKEEEKEKIFNNVKGYITGANLFNKVGLTTQVPNIIDIVTNECNNNNKYANKYLNVIIRKPKIEINNENYKYLQLIDLIENKDNIYVEVDDMNEIIYNFIQENDLDFEKILKYARETNSKAVIEKMVILAR